MIEYSKLRINEIKYKIKYFLKENPPGCRFLAGKTLPRVDFVQDVCGNKKYPTVQIFISQEHTACCAN